MSPSSQAVHASVPGRVVVSPSPEPQDVLWGNLYVTRTARTYRGVVIDVVVILLLMVYVVPVTLIALLVSPDNLASRCDTWTEREREIARTEA